MAGVGFQWRGEFRSAEVEALHAEGFGHEPRQVDWLTQVRRHSLGWVCARREGVLIGFLNVAWDGGGHAFVLDPAVTRREGRAGVGTRMVSLARAQAAAAGCRWLHVDFAEHLRAFYVEACGFTPTSGGLIDLAGDSGVG